MKKFTLIMTGALMAVAAQAQYSVNPSTSVVAEQGPKWVDYVVLSDDGIKDFTDAGAAITYVGPDPDAGRNLWYWDNTFLPGSEDYPRVDMAEGGYVSLEVSTIGWSGAGFAVSDPGINLEGYNENTRFHCAYMTPSGNGPASVAFIICDGDLEGSAPAKVAVGTSFNDGGVIYPTIGPALNDDWQGIDISFADLKKQWPTFNVVAENGWKGNLISILGGGVAGQTLAFDAMYFYSTESKAGVADAELDNSSDFVVTKNTVNVMNGNGITLYNLAGQVVKTTEGTTLGISNLQNGVYIARSGKLACKVVVK